jgi:hypothetical protein
LGDFLKYTNFVSSVTENKRIISFKNFGGRTQKILVRRLEDEIIITFSI